MITLDKLNEMQMAARDKLLEAQARFDLLGEMILRVKSDGLPEETLRAIEAIKEEEKANKLRLKFRKTPVATVTVIEDEQEAAE